MSVTWGSSACGGGALFISITVFLYQSVDQSCQHLPLLRANIHKFQSMQIFLVAVVVSAAVDQTCVEVESGIVRVRADQDQQGRRTLKNLSAFYQRAPDADVSHVSFEKKATLIESSNFRFQHRVHANMLARLFAIGSHRKSFFEELAHPGPLALVLGRNKCYACNSSSIEISRIAPDDLDFHFLFFTRRAICLWGEEEFVAWSRGLTAF